MKHVVICIDGAADWPMPELNNRTPLEAARMPNLQRLAKEGVVGRTQHAPEGMDNGSDVCCMALLGFDPRKHHTGRAPIEARSLGIDLKPDEIAVRCNTVTVQDGTMVDYSAGHIKTEESRELILAVDQELGRDGLRFHPGVQYRHILVAKRDAPLDAKCTAPHNITGQPAEPHLPQGADAELLRGLMERSKPILANHPVNRARVARGENPATQIWLWGHGPRPSLPLFKDTFGLGGAMISAVDLLKSLGLYLGLEVLEVPGITGFVDTDYSAKARYAIAALERHDLVFVHVEAPDECGHLGDWKLKTESLEQIDAKIVGPLSNSPEARADNLRLLLCPDHATPCAKKSHATELIPFLAWGPGFIPLGLPYGESAARLSPVTVPNGHDLMGRFLKANL
ncbi:MAG: cofactor-independent phosphoglycerate mutase [Planctomycetota bacterium]|nr:cofactor-independent phosphoglycerate mutase [Planctomycetota bacterium]